MTEQEEFEKWQARISKAEKEYEPYHELIKEIREYYKNAKKKNKTNIFWSSIETLKPFLYFKAPKVYVERKSKQSNPVEAQAANILEKALEWDLEQFDFDSNIKYARNDYLLAGCGVLYEHYVPAFKQEQAMSGEIVEVLDGEKIETKYIDPADFIADSQKVGVWEECQWVARVVHMTKEEVVAQFGKELEAYIADKTDKEEKNTTVYEIWDKASKSVLYICKDFKQKILKRTELPDLVGGFPMPRPVFCTLTNDSLIPVPDYIQIKPMLAELDGITQRMKSTLQAIKVSGCYDNSFPELANILAKDCELISVGDFDKLRDNGGLAGIIDFMPIAQYVEALGALAQQRADVIQQIYEITGVSDIMRGNSDPTETATAVTKKTNFGTLRNQDRQNDMQRFINDLLKIKAEMICELFQPETLAQFAGAGDPQINAAAIQLLREDKTRNLIVGVETDTSFNQDEIGQKTIEAVQIINNMVTQAFEFVSAQPLLLPLYKQMVQSVVATLPNTRQFEPVIDEVFNGISQQLAQPSAPDEEDKEAQAKAQNDMAKNQIAAQKNQQDFAIKQEQNQIKREELAVKKQIEEEKLAMAHDEAVMQKEIADEKIALGLEKEVNANITTGYVKGF